MYNDCDVTGSLFARNDDKAHLEEELALQVAKMIITDVTMTTRCHDPTSRRHDPDVTTTTHSHDPASQRHDPDSQGHDPSPSRGASFELWRMNMRPVYTYHWICIENVRHIIAINLHYQLELLSARYVTFSIIIRYFYCYCFMLPQLIMHRLVVWHSGRTSVFDRRTFPVLRSTCCQLTGGPFMWVNYLL